VIAVVRNGAAARDGLLVNDGVRAQLLEKKSAVLVGQCAFGLGSGPHDMVYPSARGLPPLCLRSGYPGCWATKGAVPLILELPTKKVQFNEYSTGPALAPIGVSIDPLSTPAI